MVEVGTRGGRWGGGGLSHDDSVPHAQADAQCGNGHLHHLQARDSVTLHISKAHGDQNENRNRRCREKSLNYTYIKFEFFYKCFIKLVH
jgi:hypothetical protein